MSEHADALRLADEAEEKAKQGVVLVQGPELQALASAIRELHGKLERQREWSDAHRAAVEEASKIIEEKNTEFARLQQELEKRRSR